MRSDQGATHLSISSICFGSIAAGHECQQLAAGQNSNQDTTEPSIPFKHRHGDDLFPFDVFSRDHPLGGFRAGADDAEADLFEATAQVGVLQGGQHLRIERRDDGFRRAGGNE